MQFVKYPKIYNVTKNEPKDEIKGILQGNCVIQEKIDGANISIWLGNDGGVCCGSRNQELTEGFNGFVDYVKSNEAIKEYLILNPQLRLYGEWLVKHTINYPTQNYKKIFLFDIVHENGGYFEQELVKYVAEQLGLEYPQLFGTFTNPDIDELKEFVGKSFIGEHGEGVVIKNLGFINQFGDLCYGKIVTKEFKEKNALLFGNNFKGSETYWEKYIVDKYVSEATVHKIMNKLQPTIDETLGLKHTPRVAGTCYHDMITENSWEIAGKVETVNFKTLKNLATRKYIELYKDILTARER